MCRLAYIKEPEKFGTENLTLLFTELEKSQGGDGNGIAGFSNGIPVCIKGAKLKIPELMQKIEGIKWDAGFIFHTRKSSKGEISDFNTHPFLTKNNYILAHNGHWSGADNFKPALLINGEISLSDFLKCNDSYIMSLLIDKFGFDAVELMTGTILVMNKNDIILYNGGEFMRGDINETTIFASEIPEELQCTNVKKFKSYYISLKTYNLADESIYEKEQGYNKKKYSNYITDIDKQISDYWTREKKDIKAESEKKKILNQGWGYLDYDCY